MNEFLVKVYRSPRHEGMYLYVASSDELNSVPDGLLGHFGKPQQTMILLMNGSGIEM